MVVNIAMPVSRPDFLHRIFAQLDMMPCDQANTNLLVYVDGNQELYEKARNFVVNSKFKEKLCVYRRKGLPNANHIRSRRKRIGDIHNEIKTIIGKCDYVVLLEDDTLMPLNMMEKLLKAYLVNPHAGFITGVQIGRWGIFTPGIWKVDNPYGITRIESVLPKSDNYEAIDGAGLFCLITKPEFYKAHNFEPYESILGPDFGYGVALRKQGYKNYVDWTLNTSHLTKKGEIKVSSEPLQRVKFAKLGEDSWQQEILPQDEL